jgi:hypothetical protein
MNSSILKNEKATTSWRPSSYRQNMATDVHFCSRFSRFAHNGVLCFYKIILLAISDFKFQYATVGI